MTCKEAHKFLEIKQREMTIKRHLYNEQAIKINGLAIEALEKQIPKKPNYEYEQTGNGISSVIRLPVCPSCNGINDGEQYSAGVNEKFCCICGQALDWSDTK